MDASAKDTKRRNRKSATIHFLRRLYAGHPVEHPALHGYWDRIAATLLSRIDFLTCRERDDSGDEVAILNETAHLLLMHRPATGEHDKAIVAIHRILGTWHDPSAEPEWETLTPEEQAVVIKRRGARPTYNPRNQKHEPQPLAAGLLKLIEQGEYGDLRRYTDDARERLRQRYYGHPQPLVEQNGSETTRDLDGWDEGMSLLREASERSDDIDPAVLARRLRLLVSRAANRGDLPRDFLEVVKAADRRRWRPSSTERITYAELRGGNRENSSAGPKSSSAGHGEPDADMGKDVPHTRPPREHAFNGGSAEREARKQAQREAWGLPPGQYETTDGEAFVIE